MKKSDVQLSVVIPVYNEEDNLERVFRELQEILKQATKSYEIVFVNDGSTDTSRDIITKIAKKHSEVRLVHFSRNFGKELATTAGIHHARGEAIMMFDADGQFPADLIPEFIEKWQNGAQIVTGVRVSNQKEGFVKRYGSRFFYKLMNSMAASSITPGATDFRLIDRSVQKEFKRFSERRRITRGLIDWSGFNEETIEFHANERIAGTASYSFSKLLKLAVNSIISLSLTPLYFSGYAGLIITPLAAFAGIFIIIEQLILGDPLGLNITGTAMLGILLLFFLGILLTSQGLMALYISHIHTETQGRPMYIIDERYSIKVSDSDQ